MGNEEKGIVFIIVGFIGGYIFVFGSYFLVCLVDVD